jgi:hypothetical protein
MEDSTDDGWYLWFIGAATLVIAMAVILWWMGHVPICECGYVKLWHGVTGTAENSQHFFDWYTPSHIIHGFLFYAGLWAVLRKQPLAFRFFLAVFIETAWEVFENTDFIMNRYREATISLDYYGDSIINSISDVLAMALGFVLASRLPVLASAMIIVALELFVGWAIRDNLSLNIIMLLWPNEAIMKWQAGG